MIGTRVVVQGMGSVGGVIAKLLHREGCKIVAVSDVFGGLYRKVGLNIDKILQFLDQNNGKFFSIKGYHIMP